MAWKKAYIWNGTSWDAIGNQAVATLNDYAQLSPTVTQTITNTLADGMYLVSPSEKVSVVDSSASGTINFNISQQSVIFYTQNASADFTFNFRGGDTETLNSKMHVGESYTVNFLNTNGSTPYYANAYSIDGVSVTPKWMYGSAPSAGNANGVDIYNITIIKTDATPTYAVFASMAKFG